MSLPLEHREHPLRYLFLDLNAYFASVEQQERPELRGRPIAVVPMIADSTFVIAASYEAKAYGVKTGTLVKAAKEMCPGLELVSARSRVYVSYHKRVLEVAESILPIEEVCSIDEMRFRLLGEERDLDRALEIGRSLKAGIRKQVGECMSCSVGIATNPFLAKIGTEIEKPDGLVSLTSADLPHKLFSLKLTDFTGINRRMAARLNASGIFSAKDLCLATKHELYSAFGSITGERWWYLLRGFELPMETPGRKTLGHSHVLPPQMRTDQGCREVLLRLLQKASARLRSTNLWTTGMIVSVHGFDRSWDARVKLPPTQDTLTLNEHFLEVWSSRDFVRPRSVGVTFYDLRPPEQVTPSLFDETLCRSKLNHAVDEVNQKFGKNSVYLAGMEHAKDTASEKIAFNKTWLFSEGKNDNDLF
jgi:DNA polymerase-4